MNTIIQLLLVTLDNRAYDNLINNELVIIKHISLYIGIRIYTV